MYEQYSSEEEDEESRTSGASSAAKSPKQRRASRASPKENGAAAPVQRREEAEGKGPPGGEAFQPPAAVSPSTTPQLGRSVGEKAPEPELAPKERPAQPQGQPLREMRTQQRTLATAKIVSTTERRRSVERRTQEEEIAQAPRKARQVMGEQEKAAVPRASLARQALQVPPEGGGGGPVLRQDLFGHHSFTCHLFPRLSESNLQFHDIYWDREPHTKLVSLRKRRVFVSKLVRGLCVRVDATAARPPGGEQFSAELQLLDRRPFARREVVSNICALRVPAVPGRVGGAKMLCKAASSPSVYVRSNYRQKEVALQIVLRSTAGNQAVGQLELDLLDEKGALVLANRTHSHPLESGVRIEFETADVPPADRIHADSLPDVLICDADWLQMLAIYRQLLCEKLAEEGDVFADRSVWVVDPVLATFPCLLDSDRDAVDLLLSLLHKYDVTKRGLSAQESARRLRFVYMQFMLPFGALIDASRWREQLRAFVKGTLAQEPDPIRAFAQEPCCELDPLEYALCLSGTHAID